MRACASARPSNGSAVEQDRCADDVWAIVMPAPNAPGLGQEFDAGRGRDDAVDWCRAASWNVAAALFATA